MVLDKSDWSWAIGYAVGGILGAGLVALGNSPGGAILAILAGSLVYVFLAGMTDL